VIKAKLAIYGDVLVYSLLSSAFTLLMVWYHLHHYEPVETAGGSEETLRVSRAKS